MASIISSRCEKYERTLPKGYGLGRGRLYSNGLGGNTGYGGGNGNSAGDATGNGYGYGKHLITNNEGE